MIGSLLTLRLLSARRQHKMKCQIVFFSVIVENRAGRTYEIHSGAFKPHRKTTIPATCNGTADERWR